MIKTIRPYSLRPNLFLGIFCFSLIFVSCKDESSYSELRQDFQNPPKEASPWVFWYWMNASVSKEGITADLEAMKEAGIGGAYLMPIRGVQDPPQFEPPAQQLTTLWWEIVLHALNEADRVGLKIGMHACDGFAIAGGPWITPEMSMQKVVWTETLMEGGKTLDSKLEQPLTLEGYYRDIAVYAFPAAGGSEYNTNLQIPRISSSIPRMHPGYLVMEDNQEIFRSQDSCWIQYEFSEAFTCRNITIRTPGFNYASHRLRVQCSDNGMEFRNVSRLDLPRHGWQEDATEICHAIEPTSARYFRFIYDNKGFEPGAEDLEMAKWTPNLGITGIHLSGSPRLHQYRGKSGAIWRISPSSSLMQLPDSICIPMDDLVDLSENMDSAGHITWDAPEGDWIILRMGHTSTGKTNYTGGGGLGLECDKFSSEAARFQFDNWFGEITRKAGPELTDQVLKIFHIDSWECGSQNWSPVFRDEFIARRGYDPLKYLPAMAGFPLENAAVSENFLHDIRETIAELVIDNFYNPMVELAHKQGCLVSAECIAPTMVADGMMHYKSIDLPMGEFWFRSPTHDKPNDMLDGISGAHVYGKSIVMSESFTEIRMAWDEHPGMLKTLMDRNYALGINRMMIHVFAQNPWMDRKPGMTLSNIGLYFQRDQTWWKQGRAWVEYSSRCQALLQKGIHVAELAVFTGEEIPRRAVLPDRLVPVLPGIFGEEVVMTEKMRLANIGTPRREIPDGVHHSANIADAEDWCDPLNGYAYDSFNPDVLLNLASVKNGRIVLPGGASYGMLILPGARRMDPAGGMMSDKVAEKIRELVEAGATVLQKEPIRMASGEILTEGMNKLDIPGHEGIIAYKYGKGKIISGPWEESSFGVLGLQPDLFGIDQTGKKVDDIAWTHRTLEDAEIYFVSNQLDENRIITVSLGADGSWPDLYDPLTGEIMAAASWESEDGRTKVPLSFAPKGSVFIILERPTGTKGSNGEVSKPEMVKELGGNWEVRFDTGFGGPDSVVRMEELRSWHLSDNPGIRHYSGTAIYKNTFVWDGQEEGTTRYWIELSGVHNLAEVFLNGESCGVIWTPPYRAEISKALTGGENYLEIQVSNTWANRLIGDHSLPSGQRISWTTADYRLEGKPLLESGLTGKVSIYSR